MMTIFNKLAMEIGAADNATKLEHCRQMAMFAPLTDSERHQADDLIGRRFAELNARAEGVRKPRWKLGVTTTLNAALGSGKVFNN